MERDEREDSQPTKLLADLKSLPFRKKDEFETQQEYSSKMQSIWAEAKLLDQPASNLFVFVVGITPNYDAEQKSFQFDCNPLMHTTGEKSRPTQLTLEYDSQKEKRRAPYPEYFYEKKSFSWPCERDVAIDLKSKNLFRVAIIFRLEPRGLSGQGFMSGKTVGGIPIAAAPGYYSPLEPRVHKSVVGNTMLFRNRLWLAEEPRITVFRHDTGEILIGSQ